MIKNKSIKDRLGKKNLGEELPDFLPLIPIKYRPLFPGVIAPIIVQHGIFSNTIDRAFIKNEFIGVVLQKKEDDDEKNFKENFYKMGTVCKILKKLTMPDGSNNLLVTSLHRFKIKSFENNKDSVIAKVSYPIDGSIDLNKLDVKATMRNMTVLVRELSVNNPLITDEMKLSLINMNEPGKLADFVCSILSVEKEDHQFVLEEEDVLIRMMKVMQFLRSELDVLAVQRKINEKIQDKLDKQQKSFFLKEQMKAIQIELGVEEGKVQKKFETLLDRLKTCKVSEEILDEVSREIDKFNLTEPISPEYNIIRNYLEIIESLPWEEPKPLEIDLNKSKKILNRDHHHLEDVKDRILEYLAVKKLNKENKSGTIICFVGPPGVGKTSIAKSIAESLGKKFYRFSLGGVRDEAEVKGHRRTYIGALPGKIISALRILKEKDPVILLDEIDKIKPGYSGDPSAALLEVLDPEQNSSFRDHYLDLPFDLSNVLFIATANTMDTIPRVLSDRMDIIRLSGYITEEKIQIFEKYLWKKVLNKNGLKDKNISLKKDAIHTLIESYSRESGLRNLERMADKIARKIAFKIVSKKKYSKQVEKKDLESILGIPIYINDRMIDTKKVGTALGLAWTSVGGSTILIESIFLRGRDGLTITGKLGKTMNESAVIAYSFIKNLIDLDGKIFADKKIHIHVPDGATPKDGPSAGITIASAIYSLGTNQILNPGFGMTGELTLTGEVLPIGGLKEKILAARRVGIKKVIFPKDNEQNLREIADYVKKGVQFFPVSHYKDVEALLFKKKLK